MTISKSFLKDFRFHLLILYALCDTYIFFGKKKDTVFYLVITTFKSHENEKLSRTHILI